MHASQYTYQTLAGLVRRRHPSKFQDWAALLYQPSYSLFTATSSAVDLVLEYQACRVSKEG
jgi:hypothetical protein